MSYHDVYIIIYYITSRVKQDCEYMSKINSVFHAKDIELSVYYMLNFKTSLPRRHNLTNCNKSR